MLYVEQPAGVGFSYSNTTSDYTVGDAQAAADVYAFLVAFFTAPEFAQYAANDLYISGESYGGHYVPSTTAYIVNQVGFAAGVFWRGEQRTGWGWSCD